MNLADLNHRYFFVNSFKTPSYSYSEDNTSFIFSFSQKFKAFDLLANKKGQLSFRQKTSILLSSIFKLFFSFSLLFMGIFSKNHFEDHSITYLVVYSITVAPGLAIALWWIVSCFCCLTNSVKCTTGEISKKRKVSINGILPSTRYFIQIENKQFLITKQSYELIHTHSHYRIYYLNPLTQIMKVVRGKPLDLLSIEPVG